MKRGKSVAKRAQSGRVEVCGIARAVSNLQTRWCKKDTRKTGGGENSEEFRGGRVPRKLAWKVQEVKQISMGGIK